MGYAKGYVNELLEVFADAEDLPDFDLKDLERKAGFLVHLSMTYPLLSPPFMRGFYLTMNTWREGRDQDGWKMTSRMWRVVSGKINYELLDTIELIFVAFDEAKVEKLNLRVNLFVVLVAQ